MLVVLFAFLGLAMDVGYLQWTRRRLQIAADAAAVGGAQEVSRGSTSTKITSSAKGDASLNGFTNGTNGVTVTVNDPPASGAYAGVTGAVEVIIAQNVPLYFASVLGITSTTVSARAVSLLGANGDCIYVLDGSKAQALYVDGAINITLACGAIIDSTSAQAMYLDGAINWSGPSNVVGGYSKVGAVNISPAPNTGVAAQSDPLAYLAAPSYGACDHTNFSLSGAYNTTIGPGVYCGGITMTGAGNVTMNGGLYVLEGGGLSVNGAINITGNGGITFYNTQGTGYPYGPIAIVGASNISLTAPTTGSLAGILFFQDRTIANPAASSITGASNGTYIGALYFPTSALTYSGASNGQYTIIVSDALTFSGAANVGDNYSSLPGGSPIKGSVVLGE
jgi:hypothetical protein